MKVAEKEEAGVGGLLTGTAGEVLVGVRDVEDRVEPLAGGRRADAAEGGVDDGEEGAAEIDAAGKMFGHLLGGAGGEKGGCVVGGGAEVRWEERARDGAVEGEDGRVEVVRCDDEVDFFPAGGAGAEAVFGGGVGAKVVAAGGGDDADEGVVAAGAVATGSAGKLVEGVDEVGVEWVGGEHRARGWEVRARRRAVRLWRRGDEGKRQAEAVAVVELGLLVGEDDLDGKVED